MRPRRLPCPSVYEPFGIINLEAMALRDASRRDSGRSIKEVVVDGGDGLLVPPSDPARLVRPSPASRGPEGRHADGVGRRRHVLAALHVGPIAQQTWSCPVVDVMASRFDVAVAARAGHPRVPSDEDVAPIASVAEPPSL